MEIGMVSYDGIVHASLETGEAIYRYCNNWSCCKSWEFTYGTGSLWAL